MSATLRERALIEYEKSLIEQKKKNRIIREQRRKALTEKIQHLTGLEATFDDEEKESESKYDEDVAHVEDLCFVERGMVMNIIGPDGKTFPVHDLADIGKALIEMEKPVEVPPSASTKSPGDKLLEALIEALNSAE